MTAIPGIDELAPSLAVHHVPFIKSVARLRVPDEVVLLFRGGATAVIHPPVVPEAGVGFGHEQVSGPFSEIGGILPQWADVIEDPEAAAMS